MPGSDMPRRGFLRTVAFATAATTIGGPGLMHAAMATTGPRTPAPAGSGRPPETVKLGVASYSLRKFSRQKAIEMTRALGAPYINLKSVHLPYEATASEIAAARQEIEAAGLKIVGGGTITFETDTDEGVRKYFDYARAAGMPVMVSTCKPAVLPRVERFAKQYDIAVAIHNHGPEDKDFPSPYDVLKAVRGMDRRMGLCMDIGHTARTGTDIVQAAADAGPRLLDMHVKDLADSKAKESQCIVGQGVLPIAELFRQLQAMRYRGCANLEYEIDEDSPLPGMQQSFAYMRGALAGIGSAATALRTPRAGA